MVDIFQRDVKFSIDSMSDSTHAVGFYSNGVFQKTITPLGVFVHKVSDLPKNLGLEEECDFSFVRNTDIPKLPYTIFESILEFFREVSKDISSEVYVLVLWDKVKKDFFIHVPKQEVSGSTVSYERDPEIFSNPNYISVLDIHSHVNMDSFFSSVDVADEVAGRYFGVLGKINSLEPKLSLKVAFNKQYKMLAYDELFDDSTSKILEDSDYSLNYDDYKNVITEIGKVSTVKVLYDSKGSDDSFFNTEYYHTIAKDSSSLRIYEYDFNSILKPSHQHPNNLLYNLLESLNSTIVEKGFPGRGLSEEEKDNLFLEALEDYLNYKTII